MLRYKKLIKAIDYGNTSQSDPYVDIATIMTIIDLHNKKAREHEKILLTEYLGCNPAVTDIAKLYLMKQLVLIKLACGALSRLESVSWSISQYELMKAPAFAVFVKAKLDGEIDFSKSEDNLAVLKLLLTTIIANFESEEFHDALQVLAQKKK